MGYQRRVHGGFCGVMENGPVDLVLVRHGESEGNLAQIRSKHGVEDDWKGEFGDRHSSRYRLTDEGRRQAEKTGEFIKENIFSQFDMYYTSEYARAMETAALLGMKGADWNVEFNLRERDNGVLGSKSKQERKKEFADELARRERDLFYWQPPGGESVATMCLRVERFLRNIEHHCAGMKVLVVCHGNIMEGFRILLDQLTQHKWIQLRDSSDPRDKIHNCQIFWYSRRNPNNLHIHGSSKWVKSICPWNLELSYNEWERVERPKFTNDMLLDRVQSIPQLVNNDEKDKDIQAQPDEVGIASYQTLPS